MVARQQHALPAAVVNGESKHAVEPVGHVESVGFVGMHDHFRVALRLEHVAKRLQLGAQLAVVVDLAVEDDTDRAVLVEDRLVPAGQVDDRQPPHPEPDPPLDVDALVIGAAMHDRGAHAPNLRFRRKRIVTKPCHPHDPAHGAMISRSCPP